MSEEEDYRYEEEKPHSREAAIIMLADSVEAAAKAMKNPTVKKLQGLIHEIFKQKMDDGQLDQSLTDPGRYPEDPRGVRAGPAGSHGASHRVPERRQWQAGHCRTRGQEQPESEKRRGPRGGP